MPDGRTIHTNLPTTCQTSCSMVTEMQLCDGIHEPRVCVCVCVMCGKQLHDGRVCRVKKVSCVSLDLCASLGRVERHLLLCCHHHHRRAHLASRFPDWIKPPAAHTHTRHTHTNIPRSIRQHHDINTMCTSMYTQQPSTLHVCNLNSSFCMRI